MIQRFVQHVHACLTRRTLQRADFPLLLRFSVNGAPRATADGLLRDNIRKRGGATQVITHVTQTAGQATLVTKAAGRRTLPECSTMQQTCKKLLVTAA